MARFTLLLASSLSVSAIACLDAPSFVLDEAATDISAATPVSGEGDDQMILVPSTTFSTAGTLAPTAPGRGDDDEEKDDGKGKGKGDAGGGGTGDTDAGAPPAKTGATTFVPAFWIDTREAGASAYASCVAGGVCTAAGTGPGCAVAAGLDDHPANCVSVDQARVFCAWRGKRLVANDEWTAAAAGAELRPYPWGTAAPSAARLNACGAAECGARSMYPEGDGHAQTAPRASFASGRSREGVWDLAGNVAEWVDVAGTNVTRGGSFADYDVAQVSALAVRPAAGADVTIGFRCAKDQ